jgi:transcriptional regulator with XRE-family HTH domain
LSKHLDHAEEIALAMAQSALQGALNDSGLRRSDVAARLKVSRPFITKMLRGDYNLTVKSMARVFAACGFEVRFERVRVTKP